MRYGRFWKQQWRVLSAAEQQQADALADRVCAMTYRLGQRSA